MYVTDEIDYFEMTQNARKHTVSKRGNSVIVSPVLLLF